MGLRCPDRAEALKCPGTSTLPSWPSLTCSRRSSFQKHQWPPPTDPHSPFGDHFVPSLAFSPEKTNSAWAAAISPSKGSPAAWKVSSRSRAFCPCYHAERRHLPPSSLESSSLTWQGKQDEKVNQPSKRGCPSATSVLREASVSSRLDKDTLTYAAETLPSISSKLKLAMGLFHLFKSTCLIWHN